MSKTDVVPLDGWPSRRPVKLAGPASETVYASRQERTKVTLRLPTQVADQLRVWCATTKQTAQDLVTALLVSHFRLDGQPSTDLDDLIRDDDKKQKPAIPSSSTNQSTGRPDGQPKPSDLLTREQLAQLPELEREALRFYQAWFENLPRHRDRIAFSEVAHVARHHILAGIGMSKLRAKSPVRSFRYCLGAIEEVAESAVGPEFFQNVLRHLHQLHSQPTLPSIGAEVKEFARHDSEM